MKIFCDHFFSPFSDETTPVSIKSNGCLSLGLVVIISEFTQCALTLRSGSVLEKIHSWLKSAGCGNITGFNSGV